LCLSEELYQHYVMCLWLW